MKLSAPVLGLAAAGAALAVDRLHKWWMLGPFDLAGRSPVRLTPFFDLVLQWNHGISYGLFPQYGVSGRWALIGLSALIIAALSWWLIRAASAVHSAGLGLILGGAVSNVLDRVIYGAVADFFLFHWGELSWYVFNLADTAIVVGAVFVLYDSLNNVP